MFGAAAWFPLIRASAGMSGIEQSWPCFKVAQPIKKAPVSPGPFSDQRMVLTVTVYSPSWLSRRLLARKE